MPVAFNPTLQALQVLPDSAVRLEGVSWLAYQVVLGDLEDDRATRLTYHQGILEIRMPSRQHEIINRLLSTMINVLAVQFGQNLRELGSATFNQESLASGVEPDGCFYFQHPDRTFDLESESLSPDLVIEVDIASSSRLRFPVYAAMQVQEIWLYRKAKLQILGLGSEGYELQDVSQFFPSVTAAQLNKWLAIGMKEGNLPMVLQVQRFLDETEL
jgi:Uma2 family endonuclease